MSYKNHTYSKPFSKPSRYNRRHDRVITIPSPTPELRQLEEERLRVQWEDKFLSMVKLVKPAT